MRQIHGIHILIALAIILAGCSAHFRKSLKDYEKNAPVPFHLRTLEWLEEIESSEAVPEQVAAETRHPAIFEERKVQDSFVRIGSEFFGLTPEAFEQLTSKFESIAQAEKVLSEGLELDELTIVVALHNPEIKAARERWSAVLNQYSQAEFLENLIAEYRTFTRYLNVETGNAMNREMAQRFFPYPSTISLKGEIVREQVRMAELDWRKTLRDKVVEAGELFYE